MVLNYPKESRRYLRLSTPETRWQTYGSQEAAMTPANVLHDANELRQSRLKGIKA